MDRIEQAATVAGGVVLSVTPKVAFGSTQDRAGDGVPTWMAQSAAGWPERRDLAGWCRVGRQLRKRSGALYPGGAGRVRGRGRGEGEPRRSGRRRAGATGSSSGARSPQRPAASTIVRGRDRQGRLAQGPARIPDWLRHPRRWRASHRAPRYSANAALGALAARSVRCPCARRPCGRSGHGERR